MKLLGIIGVCFDITAQLLEKKRKCLHNETVHQLFLHLRKAYDSVRREVLYNRVWFIHEASQAD
jgi:hypothetical protein